MNLQQTEDHNDFTADGKAHFYILTAHHFGVKYQEKRSKIVVFRDFLLANVK